jgi:phosphatidate cytidylyltransferase
MTTVTLFGVALHAGTAWLLGAIAVVLAAAPVTIAVVGLRAPPALRAELWRRYLSWLVIIAIVLAPILAGRVATIVAVGVLGLFAYREYARATGLFRERAASGCVALGIVAMTLAALDAWYGLFLALIPLAAGAIAIATIPLDRPEGYIQRVGLALFGFLLFGAALGHLGYVANAAVFRPVVILVLMAVALTDVFAFVVGKALGRRKLLPRTSPNKTVAGALGALVLTTAFVAIASAPVFAGTPMEPLGLRVGLGLIVGVLGQAGDLMLSSIKRDLGIKDTGVVIPGHGGLLDRCNSLLLVAPAAFHYLRFFGGVDLETPARLMSG